MSFLSVSSSACSNSSTEMERFSLCTTFVASFLERTSKDATGQNSLSIPPNNGAATRHNPNACCAK